MKQKITIVIILSLVLSFFVTPVFAADVAVGGKVANMDSSTIGSKVVFKDSSTQKEVITKEIDPLGNYVVYVPEGTYDIVIVSSSGKELNAKTNQTITSNTIANVTLPSNANPKFQNIPQNTLEIIIAGIVLLLIAVIGFVVWKKNK